MEKTHSQTDDPESNPSSNTLSGTAQAIKRRALEYFSIKETALKELRARWGRPLKTFRARKDIAHLHTLTHQNSPYNSVDDDTWQDLDMDDLFDHLDSNITPIGRQYLYRQLRRYETDENTLRDQHLTFKHFVTDAHLREQTQLRLMGLRSANVSLVTHMLFGELPNGDFPKVVAWLLAGTSLMTILIALINPALFWLPISSIAVNFVFTAKFEDNIGRHSVSFGYLYKLLKVAHQLSSIGLHKQVPQLQFLHDNHTNIRKHKNKFRITGFDSTSTNVIIAQLAHYMNLICLFDFLIFMRYTKYIQQNKEPLVEIYVAVASLDTAISVGSYISSAKTLCNPTFCTNNCIHFTNVAHPLLDNAVPNSFQSTQQSALVTGSNMAGKSTFIKTIGINLIMAQTMYLCHAESALVPSIPVLSSIKHSDSIAEGKSYYFAEIESLMRLIKTADSEQTCVFLIDEILHGTNTVERVASAAAILDYLSAKNTVFVTTHDVELTQLLPKRFKSFHFQETADLDNLFDYKIRAGHCKTRNAISLLESIGVPSSVIDAARTNAARMDKNG